MSSPSEKPEITICLDDIRQQLEKIEDKSLSLDILDYLDSQSTLLAEKVAIIAEMETKQSNLIAENNKLFTRVSAYNDREKPPSNVNYDNIDRSLDDIIENI